MRTIKTSSLRIWIAGQIHYPIDDMAEEELNNFGVKGILGNNNDDNRPIFNAPTGHFLIPVVIAQLRVEIPLESQPANYRINNFIKAKEILARVFFL